MDVVMKLPFPMIATALAFLATGSVLAADPLRDQMKGLFEAIPEAPPVLPGEPPTQQVGARQDAVLRSADLRKSRH